MGTTPNLKLTTISEQDNPKVKDFFQDLAGDASTSNMRKIDEAVKKIQDVANAAIASSEKGKAGGVATLGSDKKVVKKQLPDLNYLPDTSTLENIPDGATRKAVTQAEKNTWNAKSNFSGSYNDLTNKPTLDFIPTSDKGIAGGVAPLNEEKEIPGTYLPHGFPPLEKEDLSVEDSHGGIIAKKEIYTSRYGPLAGSLRVMKIHVDVKVTGSFPQDDFGIVVRTSLHNWNAVPVVSFGEEPNVVHNSSAGAYGATLAGHWTNGNELWLNVRLKAEAKPGDTVKLNFNCIIANVK